MKRSKAKFWTGVGLPGARILAVFIEFGSVVSELQKKRQRLSVVPVERRLRWTAYYNLTFHFYDDRADLIHNTEKDVRE